MSSRIFMDGVPRKRIVNKIVLTIDDGPDPLLTDDLLHLLKKYSLPATFFLIGKDAEKYPDLVDKISSEGHTIANHSYSHVPWMNFFLSKAWRKEIKKMEVACSPCVVQKWFRPPYALMSPHLANVLVQEKYQLILFDIRPLDFGNRKIENLAGRVLKNIDKGGVILLHGKLPANCSCEHKEKLLEEWNILFRTLRELKSVLPLEDYLV